MSPETPQTGKGVFGRRVVDPVMHLLRVGCSPRRMAWSLAVGVAVGINPLLGSTTLLCLAVAFGLRLNLVASQISNHLVYPLQLGLFFVFLRLGNGFFHTGPLPLDRDQIFHELRHHPLRLTEVIWRWEWHAMVVWLVFVLVLTPIVAALLTPLLRRLLQRLQTADAHPA